MMISANAVVYIQTNADNPLLSEVPKTVNKSLTEGAEDVEVLLGYAESVKADWIVLDGYDYDENYEKKIMARGFKLFRIDDLPTHTFHCDVLLSQNYGAEKMNFITSAHTKKALGLNYLLLNKKVRDLKVSEKNLTTKTPLNLLISLGGAANLNAKAYHLIADALSAFKAKTFNATFILAGHSEEEKKLLEKTLSMSHQNFTLHSYVQDLEKFMINSDFVIASVGTMMWELIYLKTPFTVIPLTASQNDYAKVLAEGGICFPFSMATELTKKDVEEKLQELISSVDMRKNLIETYERIVERDQISQNIIKLFS
jgi:UDP-2,4-diacetamido-2,4,6-trideoxy-beta-L-altropyranose hydrolase